VRGEKAARLRVGISGNDIRAQHGVGPVEMLRRLEAASIQMERLHHVGGCEMGRKGERQSQHGRKLRAEQA